MTPRLRAVQEHVLRLAGGGRLLLWERAQAMQKSGEHVANTGPLVLGMMCLSRDDAQAGSCFFRQARVLYVHRYR